MSAITVRPLSDDLSFGARIKGVDRDTLNDEATCDQIREVYENRGVLVFEDMDPTSEMQVALSNVIGPPQEHPFRGATHADKDKLLGVVEFNYDPNDADLFEVGGKQLINFLPWHFDACYTEELNRGAALRSLIIPPEGGMTGFADGIQLYEAISPELRAKFAELSIVYQASLMLTKQRFGLPKDYRVIRMRASTLNSIKINEDAPRAIHPAIWRRHSGEYVLHVSPWQAAGIYGHENPQGDALMEELCDEMYAKMTPYWHKWKATDMLVWDNWRFIHGVSGQRPDYPRRVHRTTIKGDYGLGRFENAAETGSSIRMTE